MLSQKQFLWLATLILLVAAVLRLTDLATAPPGIHFDEGANATLVVNIAFEGYRPIFIPDFTGKETLWFYVAAFATRLIGPHFFVLRLTSSLLGLLTVAATPWLVRQLYPDDKRRDQLALMAMVVLAIAFWHGIIGRLAFRAISQPLLQTLTLGLLWAALVSHTRNGYKLGRQQVTLLIVAGVCLGFTGYTYLAARLFPVPLAIAILFLLLADPQRWERLKALAVMGVAALLTFAPLGWTFLSNPGLFSTRIGQVAPQSLTEALEGGRAALGMFFISGDPLLRFNNYFQPLFGPVLALFFLVGLVVVIRDGLRSQTALDWMRAALLIVWLPSMLLPTALSFGGISPSNLRAIGLVPLIAVYPALGLVEALGWLQPERLKPTLWSVSLGLLLLVGGVITFNQTQRWASTPSLYADYDGPALAAAAFINEQLAQDDLSVFVATKHFGHPTIAYITDNAPQIKPLFNGRALVLSPHRDTLAVYTRTAEEFPDEWRAMLEPYQIAAPVGPDEQIDFWAYHLPADFQPDWPAIEPQNFANRLVLEAARTLPGQGGGDATIDLMWRLIAPADQEDYTFIAEVCDQWGWCWVKANQLGEIRRGRNTVYFSSLWEEGERVLTRIPIPLPEGVPPGDYTVRVTVATAAGGYALPVIDEAGGFAGAYAEIDGMQVVANPLPTVSNVPIQTETETQVAPFAALQGYDFPERELRPGERLNLALYWVSIGRQPEDYQVELMLDDQVTLYQGNPVKGSHPTSDWLAGEFIADRYNTRIPFEVEPGVYDLTVRFGDSEPITLGELSVRETTRQFDPPADLSLSDPLATFSRQIALLGAIAPESVERGTELPVRLVWQALSEIETSYTVFIHLFDETGMTLAQRDRPPMQAGELYPTDLWLSEEVVDDTLRLAIPPELSPGEYRLRVGLYLPDTGQRLSIPNSAENAVVLPFTISVE
ncbi:MAG: hypothetical protein GYB68_06405 [Chloroflexi bacterium]|nr:hypothetical protein [Chloroflexota bacterium]